ncbi:hypothetical protein C0J52_24918 [Blattella germanica]|nr:hypothetical protein C0J52_24918 [Blattella germanica]
MEHQRKHYPTKSKVQSLLEDPEIAGLMHCQRMATCSSKQNSGDKGQKVTKDWSADYCLSQLTRSCYYHVACLRLAIEEYNSYTH